MGHKHEYVDHPTWPSHYACAVCGFAAPKAHVKAHAPECIKVHMGWEHCDQDIARAKRLGYDIRPADFERYADPMAIENE